MRLTLLSRQGCHLCEELAAALVRLRVGFDTIDVDTDAALAERYGDAIPVLLDGRRELARAPFDTAVLEEALSRAGWPAATKR